MSRVTIDGPTGVLRIAGKKAFPLGLSNGPPLGGTTPAGRDGLAELADAGTTFIRTGRGDWGLKRLEEQLATERAQLDAAAAHGLHCWLYLGDVPDLPPRAAGGQASAREQVLSTIAASFKSHPGLGAYKGVDEPRNPFRGADWIRPEGLARAARKLRALDPNHPLVIIQAPRSYLRAADALPPHLRHHGGRHLPGRVSTRRALGPRKPRSQRRRRRDAEDDPRRRRQAGVDDAPDRLERHRRVRPEAERCAPLPDTARAALHGLPGDHLRCSRADVLRPLAGAV